MDAAGLGVSIVSLVGVFQAAVSGFEYIQLGRAYGNDLQTSCLRLDNAQLRLTRWGQAIGLGSPADDTVSLRRTSLSQADIRSAEGLLGHIITVFRRAEATSREFRATSSNAEAVEIDDSIPEDARSLHHRMRDICIRRQKTTGLGKKAKWALYQRNHLNELVTAVQSLVNDLIELFPAAKPAQAMLCDREAAEFRGEAALPVLKDIALEQDPDLEAAIGKLPAHDVKF